MPIETLKREFKQFVVDSWKEKNETFILVKRQAVKNILLFLKNEFKFNMLIDLGAIDYEKRNNERFGIFYILYSLESNTRIIVKTDLPEDDCTIDSIIDIFPNANWFEREAFDMYGIFFKGHPNLTRILNPDDYDAFPMRKEFPVDKRW